MGIAVAEPAVKEQCQLCNFLSVMEGECSSCELKRLRRENGTMEKFLAAAVRLVQRDNPDLARRIREVLRG